jgi:putative transposase
LIDTLGLILSLVVHPANMADRDGAKLVFAGVAERFPRSEHVWADGGYQGTLRGWLGEHFRIRLEVVKKPSRWVWVPVDVEPPPYPKGFLVLKRRWVVERTFGWLGRYRRLSKEYEQSTGSSEAMIRIAMIHLMLRRLSRTNAS